MKRSVVIGDVRPRTPDGYPAKAVVGRSFAVSADVFRDGHDVLAARVSVRPAGSKKWTTSPMAHTQNDRYVGMVEAHELGAHEFVVEAWTDLAATWQHDTERKLRVGDDIAVELVEGAALFDSQLRRVHRLDRDRLKAVIALLRDESVPQAERFEAATADDVLGPLRELTGPDLTKSSVYRLWIDRERAQTGAWYELFPRSYGGLRGATERLQAVADMGFDVVYLPPIHPIGVSHRKGRNNSLDATDQDPGSPWAIGAAAGGHTAVEPSLGTLEDFDGFVARASTLGLEVALDYALQCSPDHPWVTEHPEWFHRRPDGSIKYAENPPKKYQDIYPINFWPAEESDRAALWEACLDIVLFWLARGVRIFRVDNPHTKPLEFWTWLIAQVRARNPEVVFLSEAFTRPKMMARLAEIGFSQSYTYFTWRTTKQELLEYGDEVAHAPTSDYMRPNFWPTTPDILSGPLRNGPPAAFRIRLLLAATMVPSYGIYSGYELYENEPFSEANEEFLHSEKYEIKARDFDHALTLAPLIARVNQIRRRHPALGELHNIVFHRTNNEHLLAYSKRSNDGSDAVLVVINLDPHNTHEDSLGLDLEALGVHDAGQYEVHDELAEATYVWNGPNPYVRLSPEQTAHIFHVRSTR